MHYDEVSLPVSCRHVSDRRQWDYGKSLRVGLDSFGGKSKPFGGLQQSPQISSDPVGAGQVPHLLQSDWNPVVDGKCRQGRGAAVALIVLLNACVSSKHT
jgi:hypothetical protein